MCSSAGISAFSVSFLTAARGPFPIPLPIDFNGCAWLSVASINSKLIFMKRRCIWFKWRTIVVAFGLMFGLAVARETRAGVALNKASLELRVGAAVQLKLAAGKGVVVRWES